MKLTDLEPRWIGLNGWASESIFRVGMTFRCPHCPPGKRGSTTFLGVYFANPVDPEYLAGNQFVLPRLAEYLWQRDGDTFEAMSLTPSIDASQSGHWHGHITNGEIR